MITVKQSNDYKPCTWKGLLIGKRERRSASFTCPNGHTCRLSKYEILADGSVHPSVLCPGDQESRCNFHEFITLEGWAVDGQATEEVTSI